MSAYDVLGNNVTLEMKIGDDWFPLFCAKEVGLNQSRDEIETTHINSGLNREYVPGMANATVSCTGITHVSSGDGRVPITYIMQDSIGHAIHSFRVTLTDQVTPTANVTVMNFSGFFRDNGFTGPRSGLSNCSAVIRISGGIEYTDYVPSPEEPVCEVKDTLYIDAVEGATTVTSALLIPPLNFDTAIVMLSRSGIIYEQVTGSPGDMQFSFNQSTGVVTFRSSIPFNAGEVVAIVYKNAQTSL